MPALLQVLPFTEDDITYSLMKSSPKEEDKENQIQGVTLKESFLTDEALHPTGLDRSDSMVNYFVGDEENWRSNVPTYNAVSLGELWPSVDVELRAYGANIEKIFKVYPGGSVEDIRLSLDGILSLNVDEEGKLILETELGDLAMTKPIAFQDIDGVQKNVEASYLVEGSTYGFAVGDYDPHYPLVIDPLLASTFIGGGHSESSFAIALDSSGNVFVTGETQSSDYPTTTGAFDETSNGTDDVFSIDKVFVTKLKNDLSGPLLASTFIGGNSRDDVFAIALDSSDNVFVTGYTRSNNYPTTSGAFDETFNGGLNDVFVTKLKNDLSGPLLASTFVGGSDDDRGHIGRALALDSSDNVFVTGDTQSRNYPTTSGAFDETFNGGLNDVFVTKLKNDLSGPLLASTFIGGNSCDNVFAIALDSSDNVFVTGDTQSSNYPTTTGAFDETYNGSLDVFVTKLKNDLSGPLLVSTLIGGISIESGNAIALDSSDNVFVTGRTGTIGEGSGDYPTTSGAFDETHNGDKDVFVTKLKNDLSGPLLASTFIGGSKIEVAHAIALDSFDNVFVTGQATLGYPTTSGAFDETSNGGFNDVFVSKLTGDLSLGGEIEELSCLGLPVTIFGTLGDDKLQGTQGDDVIHGLGGNDILRGLGGDDYICGGDGDDELIGNWGNDMMAGGPGNDGMYGVQGRDVLFGNPGDDTIFGGGENDIVYGGLGDDIINGGTGNDRLFGGPNDDTLFGGDGIDELHGGTGLNVCSTGETLVDCT